MTTVTETKRTVEGAGEKGSLYRWTILLLAGPPILLQRMLFTPLTLLGRLFGYRASYPKYGDDRLERSRE